MSREYGMRVREQGLGGTEGHSCLAYESFEFCHFEEPWQREIRREASSRENRGILKISPFGRNNTIGSFSKVSPKRRGRGRGHKR